MPKNDSDDEGSVDTLTGDQAIKKAEKIPQDALPTIPLAGFGCARYGLLGKFDMTILESDPEDVSERWSNEYRYVHGYNGNNMRMISAGESHMSMLLDWDEDNGGIVYAHGLANGGRLGIGHARKENTSILARIRLPRRKGKGDEDEDDVRIKDFSSLLSETETISIKGEEARYQNVPTKVLVDRVNQISCGTAHSACVTVDGELYTWGLARHGRLGVGDAATDGSLPFDELDQNDTYIPRPTLVQIKSTKIVSVSAGHKHTLACDEYGSCYAWGSARYGRLGIGDFDQFALDPADSDGACDPYSWHVLTPQKITTFNTVPVTEVFAGAYNSFAISHTDGRPSLVFAWGLARYGMLGIGESKAACCYDERFDQSVEPDNCPKCRKRKVDKTDINAFVEERIGHTEFSRVRVNQPSDLQKDVLLKEDPEDAFDKYIPFPVEVSSMASLNIVKIFCGMYHHLAISQSGQLYSWGLLRHGRCGAGKFDPESKFNVKANKVIYDRSVKPFLRETRYDVNFKGQIKISVHDERLQISVHDETSWYLPTPRYVLGLQSKKIVNASCGEMHSAAITDEGRLFTWGCARHGRLGTNDDWEDLLLDPKDPLGRYRAEPAEVKGLIADMVACTSCTTLVVARQGSKYPQWMLQQMEEATKKKGFMANLLPVFGITGDKKPAGAQQAQGATDKTATTDSTGNAPAKSEVCVVM